MTKYLNSSRIQIAIIMVSVVGAMASMGIGQRLSGHSASFYKVTNGLNICFQRVTQSFTSLMIQNFQSEYLNSNFKSMTSECLEEVNKVVSGASIGSKQVIGLVNNLKSDYYWFDRKIQKIAEMAKNEKIDILQSNITNKYSELEAMKGELEEKLTKLANEKSNQAKWSFFGTILSLLLLGLSMIMKVLGNKIEQLEESKLETMAQSLNPDLSLMNEKEIEEFGEKFLDSLKDPEVSNVFSTYVQSLKDKANYFEDSLLEMNTRDPEVYDISLDILEDKSLDEFLNLETSELEPNDNLVNELEVVGDDDDIVPFDISLSTAMERVQDDIFNYGVILDTELHEHFNVKSNKEALDQLIYNLLTYAIQSSTKTDGSKKIMIKSRALGGIAYCKLRISGHAFSDTEVNVLLGKESYDDADINLLLMKELTKDAGASIAVKNIQNSQTSLVESEVELVFDVPRTSQSKEMKKSVIKGNKSQIREHLSRQLNM